MQVIRREKRDKLTEVQKINIMYLFWNTHDNSDHIIAKKLGICNSTVTVLIADELDKHLDKVNKRINGTHN